MWIEFSEFNIKLLIPLIFPIFKRLGDLTRKIYNGTNPLFKTFRYFLCYSLSFIPLLIIKYRSKNPKKKKEDANIEAENNKEDNLTSLAGTIEENRKKFDKMEKIKSILFLIMLSIIGFNSYYFSYLMTGKSYTYTQQSLGIIFFILTYIVLSKLILKQKYYKHSWISAGIITFILISLFIITIPCLDIEDFYPNVLIDILISLGFGLFNTLGKYYMNKFYNSPYFLMFVIGIFTSTILLILDLFIYSLDLNPEIGIIRGFKADISNISNFFIFLLDIIIEWIWINGIWLTIYYFSPFHYFISEYIAEYIYYLQKINDSKFYSTHNIIIFSISFFINLFFILVFNEVIILNFCRLDYNTSKRIKEREINDINEMYNKSDTLELEEILLKEEDEKNIN